MGTTGFTYPGVYIQELESGVHTITGAATSIAAFVGWAPQGRTDQAVLIGSWGDFQSQFGGLNSCSYLGYAVNHFFANGGQQAYIVRIAAADAVAATATVNVELVIEPHASPPDTQSYSLKLAASSPGVWGNALSVLVTVPINSSRFGIQVLLNNAVVENFVNLSFSSADPQYVVTVLNNDSQFITVDSFSSESGGTASATSGLTPLMLGSDGAGVLKPGDGNFENAIWPTTTPGTATYLLDRVGIFNLLCVPGEADGQTLGVLQQFCYSKRAFLIVDSPQAESPHSLEAAGMPVGSNPGLLTTGQYAPNSAYYFPWIMAPDALAGNRPRLMPPCGMVAGIYAATDASRGVWKAPAGIDAALNGAMGLQYVLTDLENGNLNILGINCLRQFNVYGNVVWGARTLVGNDQAGSDWKYVPIRRLALFIETSLYDGTQWVVFEPNDETLWGQIRMNVGAFMQGLFAQGAFQGTTPQQAYFVKCDAENNPQSSINLGIVNVLVGFAPLYPAEFVVIQIQQIAGQI